MPKCDFNKVVEWAFYASTKIFVQKDMLLLHQEGRPSR